ncbi:MAG TPA: type 1 glutamine amidotransferase domain-containing protein [Myxococcaceae bacterium]|nr:type 1 glutamine amidotransferase domain-containing protein [Myxococcaceae bacterium]
MAHKRLEGVRVAVLVTDGFEQVEVTRPLKHLLKHGAAVDIVSLHRGRIRGINLLHPGITLRVNRTVQQVNASDYDALLIPGGFVNPDFLRQSEKAKMLVTAFDVAGKPIATLCHGPWVLVSAGLVHDRKLAAWPGIQDDIRNAGGTWIDEPLVRDGNWVSSRSPLDLLHFERGMVELFEQAPRRSARRASPRRFAQYRPTSVLALLLGVGLHALVHRRLLAA